MSELLPEVTPYTFVTLPRALVYIQREEGSEDNTEELVRGFLNSTTAVLEARTGRKLAARSYRTATTFTMALSAGEASATCADAANLRERDELAHADLPIGTLVESISGTTVTLSKKANDTNAAAEVACGFGPLVINGRPEDVTPEGYQSFYVPEYPLQSLHSVNSRDYTGALTEVDITGARIEASTGRVILPVGYLPSGTQNIEIECVAGYLPPRAGRVSGFTEWQDVELGQFRMVKITWADYFKGYGRDGNAQFGDVNVYVNDFRWPADIRECFAAHRRFG